MKSTWLDRILAPGGLEIVFQPIFQRTGPGWRVASYEALARGPQGTNMEFPDILFEYVRRKQQSILVDRACVREALRAAWFLADPGRIGVNVHASTLEQDRGFPAFLHDVADEMGFPLNMLTLEVVEHSPCWSGKVFRDALSALRETGARIALDDIGLGDSNYRMILECRPDAFKIDRFLVNQSGRDTYRCAVLRSIADLAARFGASVVAEGVDNTDDLRAVLDEGIDFIQGFLLAEPVGAAHARRRELEHAADRRAPIAAPQNAPARVRWGVRRNGQLDSLVN